MRITGRGMVVVDCGDPAAAGRRGSRAVGQELDDGVRVCGQRGGAGDGAPVGEQRPDRRVPTRDRAAPGRTARLASHGSWLKVPLGKLGTERTVPLDEATLNALNRWTSQRGTQRALPRTRTGKPTDFLFVEHGRRLSPFRLRKGLADAAAAAGLCGRDGATPNITPHQLRHTYGTALVIGGMSLQARLGHVSAEMTLRYASLGPPTVRAAYDQAMSKARKRLTLPIAPVGQALVPDRFNGSAESAQDPRRTRLLLP